MTQPAENDAVLSDMLDALGKAVDAARAERRPAEKDAPEQPPIGGLCETCGHFAGRHDEMGCHFDRPDPKADCDCKAMCWLGRDWPRPWLPAPEGTRPSKGQS